jgi:hypothetical protein
LIENLKGRDHFGDLGVNGRVMLGLTGLLNKNKLISEHRLNSCDSE